MNELIYQPLSEMLKMKEYIEIRQNYIINKGRLEEPTGNILDVVKEQKIVSIMHDKERDLIIISTVKSVILMKIDELDDILIKSEKKIFLEDKKYKIKQSSFIEINGK